MTDFIHEHPKNESPAPPPSPAPEPEEAMDEKTGQKRVYGYIFLLFIVALSLLLWAFLMNQRSADEMLSELRGNSSTLQSTLDRNIALEAQLDALEKRVQELTAENKELETKLSDSEKAKEHAQQNADQEMDVRLVYYAELKVRDEDYAAAAAALAKRTTSSVAQNLWDYDATHTEPTAPGVKPDLVHTRYEALVEQLTELGYLTSGENGQLQVSEPASVPSEGEPQNP